MTKAKPQRRKLRKKPAKALADPRRNPDGTIKPGATLNPGGRTKETQEALGRGLSLLPKAIALMEKQLNRGGMAAGPVARLVFEKLYPTLKTPAEYLSLLLSLDTGGAQDFHWERLSTDELRVFRELLRKGTAAVWPEPGVVEAQAVQTSEQPEVKSDGS